MSTYLPERFRMNDEATIRKLIADYPFATLFCQSGDDVVLSHLPLVLDPTRTEKIILLGHMAAANPHWHLLNGKQVTAIIHGPHSYITPRWYVSGRDVPTWNYAVVHLSGLAKILENPDHLMRVLKLSVENFEKGSVSPWEFSLPDDLSNPAVLSRAIVGFEIQVTKFDAKFKLSQNRSEADRAAMIAGLDKRGDEMSRAVSGLMQKGMIKQL